VLYDNNFSPPLEKSYRKIKIFFSVEITVDFGYIDDRMNMKNLQPYWFMMDPIDTEHKYYVLMDFLQSLEEDLKVKKYSDQVQKLNRIYNDLRSFEKHKRLSDRTIKLLNDNEIVKIKEKIKEIGDSPDLESVVVNSLDVLDEFIDKIHPYMEEVERSLDFQIYNDDLLRKDRGYVIMRNNKNKKIKAYSWVFSIVKVDDSEQVGLLLSELLDPLPDYTKSNKKVYDFFTKEIRNFSKHADCFIIVDLEKNKGEDEISFDLIKEKAIEFIIDNYKKYLSTF
jgi:hypothetical protein